MARFSFVYFGLDDTLLDLRRTEYMALADLHVKNYLARYPEYGSNIPGAQAAFVITDEAYSVGILTNGFVEVQHAKMDQFPELRRRASAMVISEEVGFMKPDPRIFAHATQLAAADPGEILYTGDSYRSDVQGGAAARWNAAWFSPGEDDGKPDHRFQDSTEPASLHKSAVARGSATPPISVSFLQYGLLFCQSLLFFQKFDPASHHQRRHAWQHP